MGRWLVARTFSFSVNGIELEGKDVDGQRKDTKNGRGAKSQKWGQANFTGFLLSNYYYN